MAILDWFKEIPLSAVLKEKLIGLENENSALKSENTVLKVSLSQEQEKRRALEEQIMEEHNNPLTFDEKTGTWIGTVDSLRYCAKCKSQNISSPMTNETSEWRCLVCDGYFPDPDRKQKTFSRPPTDWRVA